MNSDQNAAAAAAAASPDQPALAYRPAVASAPALPVPAGANPFPPLIVLGLAVLVWVGYQTYLLVNELDALQAAATQLAPQVEAATKLRGTLDSIAAGVKRLSDGGNANAKVIVDELARRGVTINPNSTPVVPPAR